MSEQDKENSALGADNATGGEDGTSSTVKDPADEKSEEVSELEAKKAQLEAEIAELEPKVEGLEGARKAKLDELERVRKEKAEAEGQSVIDLEATKKEITESVLGQVKPVIDNLNSELAKAKAAELSAKKQALDSINARMASASGSSGQSSPDSLVENEVELSNDEKEILKEFDIKDPRYIKEAAENSRL